MLPGVHALSIPNFLISYLEDLGLQVSDNFPELGCLSAGEFHSIIGRKVNDDRAVSTSDVTNQIYVDRAVVRPKKVGHVSALLRWIVRELAHPFLPSNKVGKVAHARDRVP